MSRSDLISGVLGLGWVGALVIGIGYQHEYDNTPGPPAVPPPAWPGGTAVPLAADRPTLILFVHPHCPCSAAAVSELADLLAAESRVAAEVLFVRPPGVGAGWEQGGLWSEAAKIPGVRVRVDEDGTEARRFGAVTSGQALLFAPDGRVLFRGGLTGGRGRRGPSPGRAAVLAHLSGDREAPATAAVFGCPLLDLD